MMRASLLLLLLAVGLAWPRNAAIGLMDFQYRGEDKSKDWMGPFFSEAIRIFVSGQENVSIMPARQMRIHRTNHKKGNKPSDLYQFGDVLDLDYLLSMEYDVEGRTVSPVFYVWSLRKQTLKEIRLAAPEDSLFALALAVSAAFMKMAAPDQAWNPPAPPCRNERVFGIYAKAVEEYAKDRIPEALFSARRALDFQKDFSEALALLAEIYLSTGQAGEALKAADASLAGRPGDCRILALRASIVAMDNNQKGLRAIREMKSGCGRSFAFNAAAGRIYLKEGLYPIAISSLVKAIADNPGITECYALAGRAYLGSENYAKAVELFEKAVRLEPMNLQYRNMLGLAQRDAGNLTEAVRILEGVLSSDPEFLPAVFTLSGCYIRLGWHKKAFQLLEGGLARHPESPDLLTGMGVTYMEMNDFQKAEEYFRRALAVDRSAQAVLNNYGVLMLKKRDFKKAEKFLEKAAAAGEPEAGIYYNLGLVQQELNDFKEAEKNLLLALEASPANKQTKTLLIDITIRSGDTQKALSLLSELIGVDPLNYEAKVTYSRLLFQTGREEEAISVLEDVVKNNPGNNDFLFTLADAYKRIGWYDVAMLKLDKILKENEKNVDILSLMGELHYLKAMANRQSAADLGLKSLLYLKKAAVLSPLHPRTLFWYGKALLEFKKDRETALPLLKKCLDTNLDPALKKEAAELIKHGSDKP